MSGLRPVFTRDCMPDPCQEDDTVRILCICFDRAKAAVTGGG